MTVQFVNTSSGPVNSVTWDLGTATTAEQSPDHVYTVAGSYTIGLTVYGPGGTDTVTKTDLFTVQPGPPVSLEISPSDVAIAVQESAQFIAMAADEFGNIALVDAVWTTTGGGGSISDGGAFMAGTMAGEFADIVIASVETGNGDLLAHASITVEPGPLHLVDMASLETPVQVGTQQSLSFAAYDEFLNEITDAVKAWEVAEAAGTITNDGAFEVGTRAGDYPGAIELSVVRGSERIVVTSDLTLLPGPLAEVKVEPSYVLLDDKEDSYQFTAVGADAFGNEISGLAFVWDEHGRQN